MKIAISGASGYVGTHLMEYLKKKGHEVIALGRNYFTQEGENALCGVMAQCEAVVNLAGAPINKRWSASYKRELYESRIHVTRALVEAMHKTDTPPRVFVSASAVGYYAFEQMQDEVHGIKGDDFLSDLCEAWEAEASRCPPSVRLVVPRLGVVISPDGGALAEMVRLQRLMRFGVVIGHGKQPFPWISMLDLCRAVGMFLEQEEWHGVVNLVSPHFISQRELAHALAHAFRVRLVLPLPKFLFRLRFGEGASFVTKGQRVMPGRLIQSGFVYRLPKIEMCLKR